MKTSDPFYRLLPLSSPNCVHEWAEDPMSCCVVCQRCGYQVSAYELESYRPGVPDMGHNIAQVEPRKEPGV